MKCANVLAAGCALWLGGCATGRPTSGAPGGAGGSPAIPDTTPDLGPPADSLGSEGGASFFRGQGPALKMPEALRDDDPFHFRRITSRWNPATGSVSSSSPPTAPASSRTQASGRGEPAWTRQHRSTDQRPIETLRVGGGAQRVVVLGSLHGDEAQSVALTEELARRLAAQPDALGDATVLFIRTANPDGWSARSPYNAHGVDLNRNFPSRNWKSLPNGRSGSKGGSEVETRVVAQLLRDFRPNLIVHLKDSRGRTVVNSEGAVQNQAANVARLLEGRAVTGLGSKTTGSLEHFALIELGCPSLTLLVAREASDEAAWSRSQEALLAAVGARPANAGDPAQDQHPFDAPAVRNSSLRQPAGRADERTLSPSRPSGARRTLPDFPAPIPDRGYIELPPP